MVHLRRPVRRASIPLTLALSLLAPCLVHARAPSSTEHRLEFSLGYADTRMLDQAATRLPYHSPGGHLRLRYAGEGPRLRWQVGLQSGVGPMAPRDFPDRTIPFATIDTQGAVDEVVVPMRGLLATPGVALGVQGKLRLGASPRSPVLLLGGALGWDVWYPQGFVTPGLMQAVSFQPTVGVRVDLAPRHRLELTAATTVGAYTTRMAYHQTVSLPDHNRAAGLFAQGSRWQSLGSLQRVDLELRYEHRITRRVGVEARYGLRWQHQALPRDLRSLEQVAALGVDVHF